jgi:Tfp pilus assembly protein PilO
MRQLTRREEKIFVICVLLVLIYGGFHGVYKPFQQEMDRLDRQILRKERELAKKRRLVSQTREVDDQYQGYIHVFRQTRSNDQVMSGILSEIEKVANAVGLRIIDLNPNQIDQTDQINRFPIRLTIDGDFITIVEFLYVLQGKEHLFKVEQFQFQRGLRGDATSIDADIVLSKILIP